MIDSERRCLVYIQLPGTTERTACASLRTKALDPDTVEGTFIYSKQYLQRWDAVALDPVHLPLSEAPQVFAAFSGLPSAVRDAGPDAWGRRVIERKAAGDAVDPQGIDYLLNGPDDGAGNLSVGLTLDSTSARPHNRIQQLQKLSRAIEILDEGGLLPHELWELLEPGTHLGGARPKTTIEDGHVLWIAKFPERNSYYNLQRIEYATLALARAAGLNVCEARLEKLGDRDVLMLRRFDRQWEESTQNYMRHGFVSALTVLDAGDNYFARDRWSYLLLADELRRWSANHEMDRVELFRRMVFNAMVTNNDDHPRNHALLHTNRGWRLSPAYDIVPFAMISAERRELAMVAGSLGCVASRDNLFSRCEAFGLSRAQGEAEITRMLLVVKGWREHFAANGVDARSIEMLERAILPSSFFQ